MLIKPNLIANSEQRFKQADFSPTELNRKLGDGPIQMSVQKKQLRQRQLLEQTDDAQLVQIGLERIIQGNDLDSINYLAKGTQASHSICRIQLKDARCQFDRLCNRLPDRPRPVDDQSSRVRQASRRHQLDRRFRF